MNNVNEVKTLSIHIAKRKATRNVLTTFVAMFVFLFALALSSCKCCDKNKGKDNGKDNGENNSVTDRGKEKDQNKDNITGGDKSDPNAPALTDKERADLQAQIQNLAHFAAATDLELRIIDGGGSWMDANKANELTAQAKNNLKGDALVAFNQAKEAVKKEFAQAAHDATTKK